jgi:hypothetical protein
MSLLNHPNLVSCYCSFVSGPVRAARRTGSCVRALCCTAVAVRAHSLCSVCAEPVGHHALLLWRIRVEHHEVGPPAGLQTLRAMALCSLLPCAAVMFVC